MKKVVSFLVSAILIINIAFLSAYATEDEITVTEMYQQLCNMVFDSNGASASSPEIVFPANRLLVKTNSNKKLDENYGATDSVEGYKNIHIFQYDSISKTDYAYQNFLDDDIEYVEYDFYFDTNLESTTTSYCDTIETEYLSWSSETVQVDKAFDFVKKQNIACENVTVAIIDSGIYAEHCFFSETRLIDSGYALVDEITGQSYPSLVDDCNHGTHVAGIIYDNTMDNVVLCPYRVFTLVEKAPYSILWAAFELAVENESDVINMSLGGKEDDEIDEKGKKYCIALKESITEASKTGIVVVVSAGNESGDADTNIPANCPDAITVAATNIQNLPDTSYSASGECIDIAAPGTKINSTVPREWSYLQAFGHSDRTYEPVPKSLFKEMSGTSMATPLVSAAAALLKSINPDITPAEVERIIKETAYVPEGWDTDYGEGIINFYNMAVAAVSEKPEIKITSDGKIEIIAPEGSDSKIYYSLDGTVPTIENKLVYTEPLKFSELNSSKIIAVCHESGKLISEPTTYILKPHFYISLERFQTDCPLTGGENMNITWRSFDPDIAKVDQNGNITGVSVGETQVYATFDSGLRITYVVTVEPPWWQQLLRLLFFGFIWYRT